MTGNLRFKLLVLFLLCLASAEAQNIPDANFRAAIASQCPSCIDGNGNLTAAAALLDSLDVDNASIADITGIGGFTMLTYFSCTDNLLSTIPALPDSLKSFYCSQNQLTSISSLPQKLSEFKCEDNLLTTLPALPGKVTQLYCSDNLLTALPALPYSLDNLTCNDNDLTTLPVLPPNISSIHCNVNQIAVLPALPASLQKLYCTQNVIQYLPVLPDSLQVLDVSGNPISCLPLLPQKIQTLNYAFTYVGCLPNVPDIYSGSMPLPLCVNDSSSCTITPKVSGIAFIDYDGNGTMNGLDIPVPGLKVIASSGSWTGITDASGNYTMSIDFGASQTIAPIIPPGTWVLNPSSFSCTTNDTTNQQINNADFALQPAGNNYDAGVTLIGGQAVAASPVTYVVTYSNNSAFAASVGITLVHDSRLSFVSSDFPPASQSGDSLSWNFNSIPPFTAHSFNVGFDVSGSVVPGDWLQSNIHCDLTGHTDVLMSNNDQTVNSIVVPAAESNALLVDADSVTPYEITDGRYLTYTIYFQNTGGSTATSAEIFDTLSGFLLPATLQGIGTSGNYSLEFSNADFNPAHPVVLHFILDDLQLPPASIDDGASRGVVQFSIEVGGNTYQNASILNKAYVRMNYNSIATATNMVNTLVQYPVGIEAVNEAADIRVAPNPTHDVVNIFTQTPVSMLLQVLDLSGKEIYAARQEAAAPVHSLSLASLPNGLYILKVITSGEATCFKVSKQ